MKQILVIHGAGGYVSLDRSDFIAALKGKDVSLESMRHRTDWKGNLHKALGQGYDVLQPRMPDADQPMYEAWKVWFEKVVGLLDNEIVLVGHSLGGLFLAKYLSENTVSKTLKGVVLVAAPYTGPEAALFVKDAISKGGWMLGSDLSTIAAQCSAVALVHSTDDPVVPYLSVQAYAAKIAGAKVITLEGKGHIRDESLPEVEEFIKSL